MKTVNEKSILMNSPFGRFGIFLVYSVVFVLPVSLCAAEKKKSAPAKPAVKAATIKYDFTTARDREIIRYKNMNKEIDELVRKAGDCYKNSDFEKAIDLYLKARKNLEVLQRDVLSLEGLSGKPLANKVSEYMKEERVQKILKRIEFCNIQISRSYYYWAQSIYFEAEKSANASDFSIAIEKCRKAYEIYPECKEEMEKMIQRYELCKARAAEKAQFKETVSNEQEIRRKNILIRQGEVLYSSGQWDKARSKFEQVIAIDPYNEHSINFLRKINMRLSAAGRRRMDLVHSERVVEGGWGALTPIIAYSESDSAGIVSDEGVNKEQARSTIQEKLASIILPPSSIDFSESPLSAVIRALISLSKDYDSDPERKGINIIALGRFNPTVNTGDLEKDSKENANANEKDAGPAENDPLVTLSYFNKISLGDAIKRVCESIKAVYKVNTVDGVVEIAPRLEDLEDSFQTEYIELEAALDAEKLTDSKDIHATYFSTVPRPEGAYTAFDPVAGRLIVTNTKENIDQMRSIFEKFNRPKPQILIQAKFVDVIMNDLEELGFQYTFSRENSNIAYANASDLKEFVYTGTESMTFNNDVNIYSADPKNKNNNWYQFYATGTSLPYKNSDGNIINPNTGTLVEAGDNVNVTYYYKDSPIAKRGVTWGRNSKLTRVYDRAGTPTLDVDSETNFGKLWEFDAFTNKGYGLNAQVYALDQAGASDMLYCPRITTMDGRTATLDMVITKYYPEDWEEPELTTMDNMPILVGSTPELEEEEEGIFFQVTPALDATEDPLYKTITLRFDELKVKKFAGWDDYSYQLPTDDGTGNFVNVPNIVRTPIFQEREINTSIQCNDNSTVVIGGMITDESSIINDKYPILGDLPLIGRLFQSKGKKTYKSNLLIFVSCRLVCPDGSPFGSREDAGTITFKH